MKKKRDDTWDYIWISAVLFGIPLTISWIKKSINPISPIIAMIGIVGVVSCGYLLSKFIKGQISGEQRNKSKIKYTSIVLAVCAVIAVIGICSVNFPLPSFSDRENVIKNVTLNGIDENSSPLAVSDFKLIKKGDTYTVVATLKKNSPEPQEGYFEFNISLFDENGKRIKSDHINTMPTPDNNTYYLLKYGNEEYLEHNIYISDKSKPVKVTFSDIKELDKTYFINYMLEQSKSCLAKQDTETSKKYALEVLKYDPENIEAKALSGQTALNISTAEYRN